jgi:hypothetical protein
VEVVAGSPPVVTVAVATLLPSTKVPQSLARLVLEGSVASSSEAASSSYALLWSATLPPPLTLSNVSLSDSFTLSSLAISPALLPAGVYQFRLIATDTATLQQASGAVSIIVNAPPRNGFVSVEPSSGEAIVTKFTFSASDWFDDAEVSMAALIFARGDVDCSGAPVGMFVCCRICP